MRYLITIIRPLVPLSLILALHGVVLWQLVFQSSLLPLKSPTKPLMVDLIVVPLAKPTVIPAVPEPITPPISIPIQPQPVIKKVVKVEKPAMQKVVNPPKPVSRRIEPTPVKMRIPKKPEPKPIKIETQPQPAESTHTPAQAMSSLKLTIPDNLPQTNTPATNPVHSTGSGHVIKPPSVAAYLHNPKPPYPIISKRLGEQGKVLLRVKVNSDGSADKVELNSSSGFERLDQAAIETVGKWVFVPAQQDGQPVSGWVIVPIKFDLQG